MGTLRGIEINAERTAVISMAEDGTIFCNNLNTESLDMMVKGQEVKVRRKKKCLKKAKRKLVIKK